MGRSSSSQLSASAKKRREAGGALATSKARIMPLLAQVAHGRVVADGAQKAAPGGRRWPGCGDHLSCFKDVEGRQRARQASGLPV